MAWCGIIFGLRMAFGAKKLPLCFLYRMLEAVCVAEKEADWLLVLCRCEANLLA